MRGHPMHRATRTSKAGTSNHLYPSFPPTRERMPPARYRRTERSHATHRVRSPAYPTETPIKTEARDRAGGASSVVVRCRADPEDAPAGVELGVGEQSLDERPPRRGPARVVETVGCAIERAGRLDL